MEDKNKNKSPKRKDDGKKKALLARILLTLFTFFLFIGTYVIIGDYLSSKKNKEITYNEFLDMIEAGTVKSVEIQTDYDRIVIKPVKSSIPEGSMLQTYYTGIVEDESLIPLLIEKKIPVQRLIIDKSTTIIDIFVGYILPFVLIYVVMYALFRMVSRGGGLGGVGKSHAKVYEQKETGVTFKDVAGQEEAKESVMELVDFLHDPAKYTRIGAKLPKGALLVGPPGTGKTLLAKAVAGEAKVPFFFLSGSDFVEMFVGVGASRVRELFKQAQQVAPCIIFIDEIDAIGKSRDSRYGGGNDEREQTLNQLLAEMDGFDTSKGIVILAATNRPEVLDKALLRPGRFDRRIIVDKPDLKGRLAVLKVHAKNVLMHDSVNLDEIAHATSGAVGSDLANIINEAAILAVKEGRTVVNQSDLMESVEVVFAGKEKKDRILGTEEKKIVAYHEVGHAMVAALQKDAEPVQKITIVPRTMGALGYTMQVPEEEKYLNSKDEMLTMIRILCGGRAAEKVRFNSITTGASNDIARATQMARQMITLYGMSDEFGMMALESVESQYLEGRTVLNCSESTAAKVDALVQNMIQTCYQEAMRYLEENRELMDEVAAFLIEKETITGKQFMEIFNRYKHPKTTVEPKVTEISLENSADETKADETKADETKADETKADNTEADDTKAENTGADETRSEGTVQKTEEVSGEEKLK